MDSGNNPFYNLKNSQSVFHLSRPINHTSPFKSISVEGKEVVEHNNCRCVLIYVFKVKLGANHHEEKINCVFCGDFFNIIFFFILVFLFRTKHQSQDKLKLFQNRYI